MKTYIKILDTDYYSKGKTTICTLKYRVQIEKMPPAIRRIINVHPKKCKITEPKFIVSTVKCCEYDEYSEQKGKVQAFNKARRKALANTWQALNDFTEYLLNASAVLTIINKGLTDNIKGLYYKR